MESDTKVYIGLTILVAVLFAGIAFHLGLDSENWWTAPVLLLFFFLAYHFDVKVPGLGSINVDQAVALPAVVLLQNPVLAGLLAGVAAAASRLQRKGLRRMRPVNAYDASQIALSITVGGWFYLSASEGHRVESMIWFYDLVMAMALSAAVNLSAFLLGRYASGRPLKAPAFRRLLPQNALWILLSSPFVALVVMAIGERRPLDIMLSGAPVLIVVWTLRLNSRLEEKNQELLLANRRQEFLRKMNFEAAFAPERREFLTKLVSGLGSFVAWDRELLLVLPANKRGEEICVSLSSPPGDIEAVKKALHPYLEDAALKRPLVRRGGEVQPLLLDRAGSQVLVALATQEVVFGILVAERVPEKPPFSEEEIQFLELVFSQVGHVFQEAILKTHLQTTNRNLLRQMNYLSQILKISELLRAHLDVRTILEKVAQGIRESIGLKTVLISLYHEHEGYFERLAQAGLGKRWDEIRAANPPADEILRLLEEKYRVGNCYFIGHSDAPLGPYHVLSQNPRDPVEPDDWHPRDMLIVPLKDKDEHLLGIISVDEPADGKIPSLDTLRALEVLANQTVQALESAQIHAQVKRQATLDGLTGLYNHAYFQKTLAERSKVLTAAGQPYTVLMMDLDNFKEINDTHGHLAGDAVLKVVAQALSLSTRKEDVAARYGGEEFAVLLPGLAMAQADPIAERIRQAVENVFVEQEGYSGAIRVTLSIGLASSPENGKNHHQILEQADMALYRAKREGKNRVCGVR